MAEALLSVQGLRKHYGGLAVTNDVSLEVRPGEIHALIGPNGAGKTTLIHQVTGTVVPDAGRIVFAGVDITRLSFPRRVHAGLARSFQITSIIAGFSVLENVALAVQAKSGSSFRFFRAAASEEALNGAARDALAEVGLTDRAAIMAGALSHGEKRALEIAIALATQPRLLLLDEPLAGAGPEETERLITLLRRLKSRYAILLVEHDMQAVFALADRISVLAEGRIIASGSTAEIRASDEVRAAYLGEEEVPC
ncbi:MAG: ABC transporter ATP-binding protein [Roseomonas sp.]|nr:ABC transporter ATP-binding protein [Roseomonas sp.]